MISSSPSNDSDLANKVLTGNYFDTVFVDSTCIKTSPDTPQSNNISSESGAIVTIKSQASSPEKIEEVLLVMPDSGTDDAVLSEGNVQLKAGDNGAMLTCTHETPTTGYSSIRAICKA